MARSRNPVPAYLGVYAWADRPSATANPYSWFYCNDIFDGIELYSDNYTWVTKSRQYVNVESRIPFIYISSATMGNNGAISSATAMATTYESAYVYLPAGAIVTNSAAGWYYFVGSSTTAGTVYNNTYTSGVPRVPSSPTAFATTGPGAFTQSTSEVTGPQFSVPAGFLGNNGTMKLWVNPVNNNSGNNKTTKLVFGSTTVKSSVTTTGTASLNSRGGNRANAAKQTFADVLVGASTIVRGTEDTTAAVAIKITGQLATATDNLVIEGFNFEILPA